MSYTRLLQLAYQITINHPRLWFFGLFLVGGFNAVLLHLLGIENIDLSPQSLLAQWVTVQTRTGLLITAGVTIIVGIVVSNIARIAVVTLVVKMLRLEQPHTLAIDQANPPWLEHLPNFQVGERASVLSMIKQHLLATIIASLCANAFMLIATLAVVSPQVLVAQSNEAQFVLISTILFLPLSFLALYINMFPPYFAILFHQPISRSFRLAHDLLIKKWRDVVGFVVVLLVLYALGFTAIFSVIHYARELIGFALSPLSHLGFFPLSAIISPVRYGGIVIAWVLLAILNTFSNIALLLLFISLVKPASYERALSVLASYGLPEPVANK